MVDGELTSDGHAAVWHGAAVLRLVPVQSFSECARPRAGPQLTGWGLWPLGPVGSRSWAYRPIGTVSPKRSSLGFKYGSAE